MSKPSMKEVIYNSIKNGSLDSLKQQFKNVDPNKKYPLHWNDNSVDSVFKKNWLNWLHYSVVFNHLDLVKYFIEESKIPVNIQSIVIISKGKYYWDDTSLHIASRKGFKKIIRYLLKAGADKMIVNYRGKKPEDLTKKESIKNLFSPNPVTTTTTLNNGQSEEVTDSSSSKKKKKKKKTQSSNMKDFQKEKDVLSLDLSENGQNSCEEDQEERVEGIKEKSDDDNDNDIDDTITGINEKRTGTGNGKDSSSSSTLSIRIGKKKKENENKEKSSRRKKKKKQIKTTGSLGSLSLKKDEKDDEYYCSSSGADSPVRENKFRKTGGSLSKSEKELIISKKLLKIEQENLERKKKENSIFEKEKNLLILKVKELENENKEFLKTVEILKSASVEQRRSNEELTRELLDAKDRIFELTEENENKKKDEEKKQQKKKMELKNLRDENERLREENLKKDEELDEMKKKFENEIMKIRKKQENKKKKNVNLKEKNKGLEKEKNDLKEKIDELISKNENLNKEKIQLQTELKECSKNKRKMEIDENEININISSPNRHDKKIDDDMKGVNIIDLLSEIRDLKNNFNKKFEKISTRLNILENKNVENEINEEDVLKSENNNEESDDDDDDEENYLLNETMDSEDLVKSMTEMSEMPLPSMSEIDIPEKKE